MKKETESIVLGAGCFWCTEAVFERLKGVISVTSGYAGGDTKDPTYETVVYNNTGHSEVIRVEFDPHIIPLSTILDVFFTTHDPTSFDKQDYDRGQMYRSLILYTDERQKTTAESKIEELNKSVFSEKEIVTQVKKLEAFYPAEDYHQHYYTQNSNAGYCQIIIDPKIQKLKEKFKDLLK
ncbi:MAG: peptide-methionine (S)-S-oxide reductase MsrA [Candidatus Roizmanbacteria bacterium]